MIWLVELLTSLFFYMFRIRISSLRFLLDYDNINDEDDSDLRLCLTERLFTR